MRALETADGLNPFSAPTLSSLGLAYFYTGHLDKAEKSWRKASALDTAQFEPVMALARLYRAKGNRARYIE